MSLRLDPWEGKSLQRFAIVYTSTGAGISQGNQSLPWFGLSAVDSPVAFEAPLYISHWNWLSG